MTPEELLLAFLGVFVHKNYDFSMVNMELAGNLAAGGGKKSMLFFKEMTIARNFPFGWPRNVTQKFTPGFYWLRLPGGLRPLSDFYHLVDGCKRPVKTLFTSSVDVKVGCAIEPFNKNVRAYAKLPFYLTSLDGKTHTSTGFFFLTGVDYNVESSKVNPFVGIYYEGTFEFIGIFFSRLYDYYYKWV